MLRSLYKKIKLVAVDPKFNIFAVCVEPIFDVLSYVTRYTGVLKMQLLSFHAWALMTVVINIQFHLIIEPSCRKVDDPSLSVFPTPTLSWIMCVVYQFSDICILFRWNMYFIVDVCISSYNVLMATFRKLVILTCILHILEVDDIALDEPSTGRVLILLNGRRYDNTVFPLYFHSMPITQGIIRFPQTQSLC